jgi:hypothetical protein
MRESNEMRQMDITDGWLEKSSESSHTLSREKSLPDPETLTAEAQSGNHNGVFVGENANFILQICFQNLMTDLIFLRKSKQTGYGGSCL